MANPITWQALRALAEKIQGRQDRDQYLRIDDTGIHHAFAPSVAKGLHIPKVVHEVKEALIQVLVPNATFTGAPQCIDGHHHHSSDVGCAGDALFWSMAAVEKFLLPYYSSFWGLEKLTQDIRDAFKRKNVLAILHRPDSEPTIGDAATADESSRKSLTLLVRKPDGSLVFTAFSTFQ